MKAYDRIGYGMRGGLLVFIDDVSSGLECGCTCVRCGQPLIAKKGRIRQHHFAHHVAASCEGASETALHLLAKELLANAEAIEVPPYVVEMTRKARGDRLVRYQEKVARGGRVRIDDVSVEKSEGDFVPDIVLKSDKRLLIVEVAVTHRVSRNKLRKLRRRNLPAIEIRLDPSDALTSKVTLKNKLESDLESKSWLFHPRQREVESRFIAMFRRIAAYERMRQSLHRTEVQRRIATPRVLQSKSSPSSDWKELNRLAEQFYAKNGRYPSAEECRAWWPALYRNARDSCP